MGLTALFDRLLGRSPVEPPPPPPEEAADQRKAERAHADVAALLEWLDAAEHEQAAVVSIVDRSKEGVGFVVDQRFEPGWPVLITAADGNTIKAVVRHCKKSGGGWQVGVTLVREERRRFDRRPMDCEAILHWSEGTKHSRELGVRIKDAGEGGVQVESEQHIEEDCAVQMISGGWLRSGRVVQSHKVGSVYRIGIQFTGPPFRADAPDPDD